jgi:hypothetical protein
MHSAKLLLALVGLTSAATAAGQPLTDSGIAIPFREVAVLPDSNPGQPPRVSVVTEDPHGRLFANDQRGPLYAFQSETGAVTEYLDLRDYPELDLLSTWEAGFQSFAFHPGFHDPESDGYGRFYTIHSSNNTTGTPDFDPGGQTVFHTLLIEWRTSQPMVVPFLPANADQPYRILMRLKQPFGNHNTGLIAFDPLALPGTSEYGSLYIAVGDGGAGGDPQENSEDASNPFGAILRIDPLGTDAANGNYGIAQENLFASDENNQTLAEIYCYGLRNPQRFGWDITTGAMYIADIGQNVMEEVNLAANGAHFGWDIREGSLSFEGDNTPSLVGPLAEYHHSTGLSNPPTSIPNRAVTLGEVARGTRIPELEGYLLVADFPTGVMMRLDVDAQAPELELFRLRNENGAPVELLELINLKRGSRGLNNANRADTRFSVNTPGKIFLSNKQDGIIRQLLPSTEASIAWQGEREDRVLAFEGLLESSEDLSTWKTVLPQPESPQQLNAIPLGTFYRSR